MDSFFNFLAKSRKALASAVGVTLTALTFAGGLPFLPNGWEGIIGTAVAVLTPIATWLVPNAKV